LAGVTFEAVAKSFEDKRAVDGVTHAIADGAFFVVLGPAGCGKTTLLRLIAGLETPDSGTVALGDGLASRPGWALPPSERHLGMMFQSGALWPHLSVVENVAFALRLRNEREQDCLRRARETLAKVGIEALAERRPRELDDDQRQRAALARCLVVRPSLVLLDEPLAGLDGQPRETMQADLARFHRELGATFIYATRDPDAALAHASEVAVMAAGHFTQVVPPRALYAEPASEAIARLVGHGMVASVMVIGRTSERVVVDVFGARVPVRGVGQSGERRALCLRAENLALAEHGIRGRVTGVAYRGAVTLVTVQPDAEGAPVLQVAHPGMPPDMGATVAVEVRDGWIIPPAAAPASAQA
jgi:iron(III) transport system ATP-binding protein